MCLPWLPHLDRLINTSGSKILSIRGPCYSQNCIAMPTIGTEHAPCGSQPDLKQHVLACRGNVLPIGGPCHREYCLSMITINQHPLCRGSIPKLYCAIHTGRSD